MAQGLARRVDLVVVPPGREGEQLGKVCAQPVSFAWQVDLTCFETGSLGEKASVLVELRPLQDWVQFVTVTQVV